ncbi:MAG: glycosyltransferase [Candidatus Marinimicrobia bacterium]|nr:glycosyltransferase [Candidatus Neomarinimicrobiota bacterium]
MRIAVVGPFPPFRGGIADLNSALAFHLSKKHHVQAFNFTTQYPKVLFPGKTQFKKGKAAQDFENHRCLSSINPLTWKKTADSIVDYNPDLVLFRYWMPFFAPAYTSVAKRIRKDSNIKIIAMCDNIIPHEKRVFDIRLTKRFLKKMDAFIVLSKKVEEELLSFIPDAQYQYSPHPIYSIFGEAPSQEQARKKLEISTEKVLMFFGLIRGYKGLDILINALGIIKEELTDYTLMIVGECYEDEKKYLSLIDQNGLTNSVHTNFSFIPDDDVSTYFSAADVVVLPYKSASQSGIVQIAYHFDTPVIVSNVGGLPEIVEEGKTGFCVDPNPESFAEAIRSFFATGDKESFRTNIVEYKKRFSWNAMITAIEELAHEN